MKNKNKIKSFINSKIDLFVSPKKKFNEIYITNHWGEKESRSGPGSKIEATENLRKELKILFKKFNITSLIDAPCGDFNWMKLVDFDGIKYTGVDIVEDVISKNNILYAKKNIEFICKNILDETLPKVDLIFCRDCLPHFSNKNIYKTMNNFVKSDSEYLITSSYPENTVNNDIITGGWRKINFILKPFNFPNPIYVINEKSPIYLENGRNYDKMLYMWRLSDLKNCI